VEKTWEKLEKGLLAVFNEEYGNLPVKTSRAEASEPRMSTDTSRRAA
jgi:hypothetical protein